ncbi:MAG: questin oxidase family protein [Pseudomonadota bacterium]
MESLAALLDDGLRFDPRYPPDLNSDHLPMALCAIDGLGGGMADLLAFREGYLPQLREFQAQPPALDWRVELGSDDRYPAVLALLLTRIAQQGVDRILGESLPLLLPGMAAEAFHPLIRLGYSLAFQVPRESAAALAYMICTNVNVPCDPERQIDLAAALQAQVGCPAPAPGGRFGAGLLALLEQGDYPQGRADSLRTCARLSLDIYRSTRNFFALHMVTATHAARVCAAFVPERLMLASLTGALMAAHRIIKAPAFEQPNRVAAPGTLDAAHALKYVYTCQAEYGAWGDERYLEEIDLFRRAGLVPAWAGQVSPSRA